MIVKSDLIVRMYEAGNLIHIRNTAEYMTFAHKNGGKYSIALHIAPFFLVKLYAPELLK